MRFTVFLPLALLAASTAACATETRAGTAPDTLAHLRDVMDDTITSDAQDAELFELTRKVAADKTLVGWTRARVVATLGPGDEWQGELTYWIGRLPAYMNGGTPGLVVDFDARDVVIETRAIHTQ